MGDLTDDYGWRVGMALRAVRQLHADSVRLLRDCDGKIGEGRRLATSGYAATAGLSNALGGCWMPEGAYRYYAAPGSHLGRVEAVCLCYYGEVVASDEPVLIVGRIDYHLDDGQQIEKVCDGWDLWYLLAENCADRPYRKVLSGSNVNWSDGKSFDGFRLIAVPLYSIESINDVVALMKECQASDSAPLRNST